jgi:NADPH:quinone reductase-like Zn-dependent oxidoreductase
MLSGIYFISLSSRSEEKLVFCEDLRADVCINYKIEDFVAKGREETGGKSMFFTTVNVIGFVLINVSIALPYFNF